mmetsp:Transcript_8971/g.19195  ORF Transcript_8971/g.19195 Transcript_8971/m.19195 type:complete len:351 (+) Transcript_8971:332-1384(+)
MGICSLRLHPILLTCRWCCSVGSFPALLLTCSCLLLYCTAINPGQPLLLDLRCFSHLLLLHRLHCLSSTCILCCTHLLVRLLLRVLRICCRGQAHSPARLYLVADHGQQSLHLAGLRLPHELLERGVQLLYLANRRAVRHAFFEQREGAPLLRQVDARPVLLEHVQHTHQLGHVHLVRCPVHTLRCVPDSKGCEVVVALLHHESGDSGQGRDHGGVIRPKDEAHKGLNLGVGVPEQGLVVALVVHVLLGGAGLKDRVGVVPAHTSLAPVLHEGAHLNLRLGVQLHRGACVTAGSAAAGVRLLHHHLPLHQVPGAAQQPNHLVAAHVGVEVTQQQGLRCHLDVEGLGKGRA